jgi:[acyl-carrier-protein] S-malonyltransferase
MQEACEERQGGMVSVIGLEMEKLREVCARSGAEMANLNSPGQTVLSGEKGKVQEAARLAAEAGARKVVPLNVAGAFHSSLMRSAADKLEPVLAGIEIRAPRFPVVANVTGRPHGGPDEIRQAMLRQITGAVQWISCVEWMRSSGVREYVECGPGKVLGGLIKRIDKDAATHNVQDVPSLKATAVALGI